MLDSVNTPLHVGTILGRYELLLPIAKGGMAQVWAARLHGTRGFQKLVAIKTILADVMDSTRMEQMFLEEAQLASQIHHSNVVQTLELGEHDGALYLVMEWVEGEPLSQVMSRAAERGGLPLPIAVNLIGQACNGLQAAHDLRDDAGALLGVVHRDVSPQNLLIGFSGTAKLVDFGIAKATARSSGLTQAGEVKGKFAYMAPEQVRGQHVDCRTDLFSLGILLYSVTTGKHPFRGAHPAETLQNICSAAPATPPRSYLPDYPSDLEQVVLKAVAKQPEHRFESASAMLEALQRVMPGALATGFDAQVAEYLKGLFGERASERRAAIRVAQQTADRQRLDASVSSVGTLKAISISQHESGNFTLVPTPVPSALATEGSVEVPRELRPKMWSRVGIAAGALLALGAAFQLGHGPSSGAGTSASSPVPREAASLEAVSAPASASGAPAPPSVVSVASAVASGSAADERTRKTSRVARIATASKAGPPAASPAPVVAVTPPGPAAARSEAAPQASTNAWDRGAFGGRH